MLKKLVKYGNSNALVLDKALLEILNIAEGAVVKIKTDGTSLIITPQVAEESLVPTIVPQEALKEALKNHLAIEFGIDSQNSDAYMHELRAVNVKYADSLKNSKIPAEMDAEIQAICKKYAKPGSPFAAKSKETFSAAMLNYKKVHEKYKHVLLAVTQLQENPEYIHESVLLAEKYQATQKSPEYFKEYADLVAKYIPEYALYQQELAAVTASMK